MKFIHVTDPHLVAPGERLMGLDPLQRLDACLADINANHSDAELCVFTGDLAHHGELAAYEAMRERLSGLELPYKLLLGNHDNRDHFLEIFPETARDEYGFAQSASTTSAGEFLFLDTLDMGASAGAYCEQRRAWLRERLAQTRGRAVYLFMHHPPFDVGIRGLDRIGLKQPELFAEVVEPHDNIRHLFFGHLHRPVTGSWRGISFSTMRGTNHQVALDFDAETLSYSHEAPAYAVVLLGQALTVVHFHDYMDNRILVERENGYRYKES